MPSDLELIRRAAKREADRAKEKLAQRKRTKRKDPETPFVEAAQRERGQVNEAKSVREQRRPTGTSEREVRAPSGRMIEIEPAPLPYDIREPLWAEGKYRPRWAWSRRASVGMQQAAQRKVARDRTTAGQRGELLYPNPQVEAKEKNVSRTPTEYRRSHVDLMYWRDAKVQADAEKWLQKERWKWNPNVPRNPWLIPRAPLYSPESEEYEEDERSY